MPGRVDELRELLGHPRAVAVGETGLDNPPLRVTREQRRLFDAQLELADELGKPVVVHSREAAEETAAALAGFAARSSSTASRRRSCSPAALERGYYVSFAGNVTYPTAAELREAAVAVPADRLLVETDSPYLAPQPVRGRPNEPANVVTVAELAARARRTRRRAGRPDRRERGCGLRPPR